MIKARSNFGNCIEHGYLELAGAMVSGSQDPKLNSEAGGFGASVARGGCT